MNAIYKPLYIADDGIHSTVPDAAIINVGGTVNSTFTVGSRALLFDDGTPTSGAGRGLNLQNVYDNSLDLDGLASIKLATGKDFVIYDDTNNSVFFKIDSKTGAVTISGDLNIVGQSLSIQSAQEEADHWLIQPALGIYTAFQIEPKAGVTQAVDLINVRATFGGTPVFKIDNTGATTLASLTTLDGLINGVDVKALQIALTNHLTFSNSAKHSAVEISVVANSIPVVPLATDVQQALEGISSAIATLQQGVGTGTGTGTGNVFGYSLVQELPNAIWQVVHNKNTKKLTCTVYDSMGQQIFPDSVTIIDANSVQISFGAPQTGSVILMLFL